MLLIFSDYNDVVTKKVISQLNWEPVIVYSGDKINTVDIGIGSNKKNIVFGLNSKKIDLFDISYIWHRRGNFKFSASLPNKNKFILKSVEKEMTFLKLAFSKIINSIPHLSLPVHEYMNNKIFNLFAANSVGLKIPVSLLTNSKKILNREFIENQDLITKGIYSMFEYNDPDILLCRIGTIRADRPDLNQLEEVFFPSFFQKEIKKAFEIRSFYFLGKTYSIAIMSQENEKTQLDFRDYSVFTRIQRYQLPSEIEIKVKRLMDKLGMKIGVLDFIYGEDGNIYFLEINPTGQINRISELGNYQLDKLIANHLNQVVNERN